uniref:Ig-like domain-containing protein n=1 Tax=Oncorhynchus mykiss TaxID=8022 RepID=A0A8C7UUZ5_ONCMY
CNSYMSVFALSHSLPVLFLSVCAIEHDPKIDGRHQAALTLKENVTYKFNCQSEGWNPNAPPLLTWYLNGKRQRQPADKRTPGRLVMTSVEESGLLKSDSKSTFSWDTELVCAASSPRSGESYNSTVTLKILRVNAHYTETSDPGLSLVLFALVRSNPPSHITWVDQSGQLVANTSDFLILDSRSYPWLTNHTLQVTLSSLSGNVSVNTSNSVVAAQMFLQSRVEVPVLGILTGGAVGFITLLILCLLHKGKTVIDKIYLPRENMSLPSNMQLKDLSTLRKGKTLLLRDRYLIRTEVEVSSMVQSNSKTGNRVAMLVPWALAPVPVVFSMTPSHLSFYLLITL